MASNNKGATKDGASRKETTENYSQHGTKKTSTDSQSQKKTNTKEKLSNASKTKSLHKKEPTNDPDFQPRESALTVLMETSLHIKAIYHIFIAILIVLLFDTVTYDLVERGKINIGISTVMNGFGDFQRCMKLWFFEFCVAIIAYPAIVVYAFGVKLLGKIPAMLVIWKSVCTLGYVCLQGTLLAVPTLDLGRQRLEIASAIIVSIEMFRFFMKIHAVTVTCSARCQKLSTTPLPTFGQYFYFLFAPTLLYRDHYPRTEKIRWGSVVRFFMEVAGVVFYLSFLWERFILPYWSDYGKDGKVEAGKVIRGMFACILPGIISFLCGFYFLLHAWLNAFAEMLTFADRRFYEEWWTVSQFSKYYKAWNHVVYAWLREHIYKVLAFRVGRPLATFVVFFVSSLAHEIVLALSFGFFYPVLFMEFGVFGLLCIPLTATIGQKCPNLLNLCMWLAFFCGNGILWSLYPMEHFARKNCPPADSDSFFIPKSWSCPEVVLKANWSFHNPFYLFD